MRLALRSTTHEKNHGGRLARRFALAASLAGLMAATGASNAGAVTIGQLGTPPSPNCEVIVDRVQPTVTSGNSYVLPNTGGIKEWTITSWSSSPPAAPAASNWKMKMFRQVTPGTFTAIAQDGPRTLTGGVLNTFPTNLQAESGDILGLNVIAPATPCGFVVAGDSYLRTGPGSDLANGASAAFGIAVAPRRLNIQAEATPTNTFELKKGKRNTKKGIGRVVAEDLKNPGELVLSGKGLKRLSKNVSASDDEVILKVRAKGSKRQRLQSSGKVKVKPKVEFTPNTGEPNTESKKLKLKKG